MSVEFKINAVATVGGEMQEVRFEGSDPDRLRMILAALGQSVAGGVELPHPVDVLSLPVTEVSRSS